MTSRLREELGYRFIEAGGRSEDVPVVCLHGILGTADEWATSVECLAAHGYRVLVPAIPFDEFPLGDSNVEGVTNYVRKFVESLCLDPAVLVGNSLGGQIALRYVLDYPRSVAGLVLAGSAGMYEVPLGKSLFRRGDREFIRKSAEVTFFDPTHANDTLVERLYNTANNHSHALRILHLARDSQRQVYQERLGEISAPTSLIWGRDDRITPPDVAEMFVSRIPNAELHFINECGHAPMIEWPSLFSSHIARFLRRMSGNGVLHPS